MRLFYEIKLLLKRHLKKTLRTPWWLIIGLMQPILYLVLYMPLLRNVGNAQVLPLSKITQIFVPGMLVIMAMGTLFAGFSFIPEIREGLIARWLVTPVSRLAILLSMILDRLINLSMQIVILLIIALILGLRTNVEGIVLSLFIVILIGIAMSSLSYIISISTRSEDALATITNTIFLPIMLLSGIMLPISLAPQWLKTAAHFNPFYYAVEASRSLFLGDFKNPIIGQGIITMAILSIITTWLAVRSLRKMTA